MLVNLPPFIDIRVQVNLRSLDGGVPKILLDNAEILRALVEFACVTMTDLMRCYPRRSIMLENMLDCSG